MIGDACDTCKPGTFDLRKSALAGCSECFCFEVTDRCRSSLLSIHSISFDDQSWKTNDINGNVEGNNGRITYTSAKNDNSKLVKSVYFEVKHSLKLVY